MKGFGYWLRALSPRRNPNRRDAACCVSRALPNLAIQDVDCYVSVGKGTGLWRRRRSKLRLYGECLGKSNTKS